MVGYVQNFLKISLFGFGFLIKKRNPIQKAIKNLKKNLKVGQTIAAAPEEAHMTVYGISAFQ